MQGEKPVRVAKTVLIKGKRGEYKYGGKEVYVGGEGIRVGDKVSVWGKGNGIWVGFR